MKKSRIILLVTMLLLVASTCAVWGATINEEGNHGDTTYSVEYEGTNTTFTAVGKINQCYTILYNKTSSGCHIDAMVKEYSEYTGSLLHHSYNVGTKSAGDSIQSGNISRTFNSSLYYYEHSATCYQSPYQMNQIVDSYVYIVNQ